MSDRKSAPYTRYASVLAAILAALAVATCTSVTSSLCCSAEVFENFRFDRDATGFVSFQLEGLNGEMLVIPNVGGEEFVIRGEKRVGANSEADAAAGLADLTIEIAEVGDEIQVRSVHPFDSRVFVVNFVLEVPERLFGQLTNENGDVTVEDLDNGVRVLLDNGTVTLTDIEGSTEAVVGNGNTNATVTIQDDEIIVFQTINGNITLRIPAATNAQLTANTDNGSVTVNNLTLTNELITNNVVTGTLGTGEGTITVATTNGSVTLTGF